MKMMKNKIKIILEFAHRNKALELSSDRDDLKKKTMQIIQAFFFLLRNANLNNER